MRKIKIFLVFHQSLDEQLSLGEFSADEIKRWFVPYAVNAEKLPKSLMRLDGSEIVNPSLGNEVLVEYQLSQYDPLLQAKGFMETSCYIHVEKNMLYGDADYVGVCQYDMRWTKKSVKLLRSLEKANCMTSGCLNLIFGSLGLKNKKKQRIYAQLAGQVVNSSGKFTDMACAHAFNWDYLLKSYNQFFNTNWQRSDLVKQPLTLWQTYLMPRQQFIELARWLAFLLMKWSHGLI